MMRFIAFFVFMVSMGNTYAEELKEAIFDLRDLRESEVIKLDGNWEFYWRELFEPGNFPTESNYYPYPELWNGGSVDGQKLNSKGFATYRCFLILPDTGSYTLFIEDTYSAFSLYFNGKLIAQNGQVADVEESYNPEWQPLFVVIPNVQEINEIVLQVANFDHAKGGALESISIGYAATMKAKEVRQISRDLFLTGSLIMGGLFFLGLYFFGRHDQALLYFSLFCIVYAYRIIGFGYYALHQIVDWSWYLTTKLEYLTLFLSTFLFGKFVQHLYPNEARRIIWDIISVICIGFIVVTILSPASIYTYTVEPFFIILLLYLILTFVIYIRAFLRERPGSQYALVSTGIVFLVFAYNILVYFGLVSSWVAASFWGYMLFFFSQSLILSFRFAYFLTNAKEQAEQASQAKTEFLSTISHEIRTPLNAVVGISHFLLEENPRQDQRENLVSLKYSAEHLTTLINDILDYNKLESGFVEFEHLDTDLSEVAKTIFSSHKPQADAKGIILKLEFDEAIKECVVADRTRLIQILNNLTDNALKFTRKGFVAIRVIKFSEEGEHLQIRFEVEDTGIGIPFDKQATIFDRFTQASSSTTREFGGTGLGLSIIKRLLELQGVQIKLHSTPGVGTKFYFDQTFKKGKPVSENKPSVDAKFLEDKLRGKRVLLVEDNPMNVMVAERFLSRWNMLMEVANNGFEGVNKASNNQYDIILMDLQMPEMDGYTAAKEIRGSKNTVPIVALTASALISIQEKVLMSGMNDYITKPFDPEELKKKIAKNLKG